MSSYMSFWQENEADNYASSLVEQLVDSVERCVKANEYSNAAYTLWCESHSNESNSFNNKNNSSIKRRICAMLNCENKDDDDNHGNGNDNYCSIIKHSNKAQELHKTENTEVLPNSSYGDDYASRNVNLTHESEVDNVNKGDVEKLEKPTTEYLEEHSREYNSCVDNHSNSDSKKDHNNEQNTLQVAKLQPRSALAKLIAKAKSEQQTASAINRTNTITSTVPLEIHQISKTVLEQEQQHKIDNKSKLEEKLEEKHSSKRSRVEHIYQNGNEHDIIYSFTNNVKNDDDDEKYNINNSSDEDEFTVILPHMNSDDNDTNNNKCEKDKNSMFDGNTSTLPNSHGEEIHPCNKHPSQMTRAEFLSQYKRAPRRGEIGQSAESVANAQKLGYVMSGSRNRNADRYVDRVQRQLHEREASKLQQQFRRIEDARMDASMINSLVNIIEKASQKNT